MLKLGVTPSATTGFEPPRLHHPARASAIERKCVGFRAQFRVLPQPLPQHGNCFLRVQPLQQGRRSRFWPKVVVARVRSAALLGGRILQGGVADGLDYFGLDVSRAAPASQPRPPEQARSFAGKFPAGARSGPSAAARRGSRAIFHHGGPKDYWPRIDRRCANGRPVGPGRTARRLTRLSQLEGSGRRKCLKIKPRPAKVCSHFPTLLSP